jgi:predicted alpha/beta-fold hydrolase
VPLLASSYQPTGLLKHGHSATILASFLPRPKAAWTRYERLELADGDFLDMAWKQSGNARLAILSHGLEGSLNASYIRGMADTLSHAGWDILAWNYRSCGGIPNRLPRSYHSGESGDLRLIIGHAAGSYPEIVPIGFSLGGNITMKYAGEAPVHPAVRAAVAVSAPVDLASSARALDARRGNRIYLRRFLKSLIVKAGSKARSFPGLIDLERIARITTIRDFDEYVTAPLHGFAGAEDYWARASALPLLSGVEIPCLLLNALNDPLLDQPSFPVALAQANDFFHLEAPAHGGHVGFPDFGRAGPQWHERRVVEFLGGDRREIGPG